VTAGGAAVVVGSADARLRPPAPSFASVAHAADPVPLDNLRPAERAFLQQASELSRLEMALAQLGVSQGASSEVRELAQQMVTDTRLLADSLDNLARKKSLVLLPATGGARQSYGQLSARSGADFDREFVRVMSPTNAAIERAFEEAMSDTTRDPDIRDLVGQYLPVLRDHLNKMQDLRKSID